MSGTSRKVKNPLLSAAGMGSPFEYYPENALLVPVTPATPAVLRDDTELDNFVGQESSQSQDSSVSRTVAKDESELKNSLSSEESKVSTNQPAKQGYFTSILSSLPNLSLSSTKSDSSGSRGSQGTEVATGKQDTNSYGVSQGRHGSLPETSSFLAANPHDPYGANQSGSGEVNLGVTTFVPPPQPSLPPTVPISTGGPVSYRLGNQRRLKYAPPPDLTSNTTKQYPNPSIPALISSSNVPVPSSILNPNAATIEQHVSNSSPASSRASLISPTEQPVTPEQLSRSTSLHGSFRSSPSAIGAFSNSNVTSQNQSSFGESSFTTDSPRYSVSSTRLIPPRNIDPATPQNTPANTSSSFGFYINQPDSFMQSESTSYSEKEQKATDNRYAHNQDILKSGSTNPTLNVSKTQSLVSPVVNTFKPISAAKVTEKLQHFLAEQNEESPFGVSSEFSCEVNNITSQIGNEVKTSPDLQSILQPSSESNEEANKIKSNDELSKNDADLCKSDSLSDIPLNQNSFDNLSSPENTQDFRKIQNITLDTQTSKLDLTPQQQLNQTQSSSTLPLDNVLLEKTSESTINLNPESTQEESGTNSKPVAPSLSAFFEPVENKTNTSFHSQQSDISTNFNQVSTIDQYKIQEYPTFNQQSTNTALVAPQTIWNPNQNLQIQSTDSVHNDQVPQPPQFYNPARLMGEAYKYQYPASIYVPTTDSVFNSQTHAFVAQSSKPEESQNIVPNNDFIYAQRSYSMATTIPESTGSATLSPIQLSASPLSGRTTPDSIPQNLQNLAFGIPTGRMQYRAIYHHWFFRKEVENKVLWLPFSMQDSLRLEDVHNSSEITTETTVATDGGRYDVDILRRQRSPVYWTGPSTEVRRCSWFYKGASESRYIPYEESIAAKLEEEYKHACITLSWNRRIDLNNGEYIIFHSANVQVHYLQTNSPETSASWSNTTGGGARPRVIKRGVDEFNIDEGEPEKVDHLLFLVHGIGSVCDLKFRTVEEVVDEFRSISLQLVQSHYRTASEKGVVNRVEVLPISWHTTLHSDTGIDKKLKAITLNSIPKLRHFTNDTLLDILFYTSPIYCQTIMQTVGNELNRLYILFKERNPDFKGKVYLGGHSLGSLIMFDLLCHQKPLATEEVEEEKDVEVNNEKGMENENIGTIQPLPAPILKRRLSKKISYVMGAAGTGQPYINYPQLNFHPSAFFAFGSPIGMFVTVRGIDTLGEKFVLPTCPAFFNIFHPFDPVAYRVESLINPEAHKYRPMLIPHHKGRKRMHLELKETMARVGADLKQKFIDSVRNTWNSVFQLAHFHKSDNNTLEREIDKVVEEQLQQAPSVQEQNNDDGGADIKMGNLNGGRRIDYVLQEAPFEYINEYIFALTSHVCYWESEDTMLMILKEIYGSMGIQTDAQLPQQTLSIERSPPSLSSSASGSIKNDSTVPIIGIDPTAPISNKSIGPPPTTGFMRKS
ncbi:SEC23-interacting protein-like isoform X2 [Vespula pensylvanica]|uniref:SEC23-interacting protein-like isoform X2 n=1 Tax=Vespula pensylvanica TaxID=30213 RepID=UPI001CB9E576|nr:SEC23-interacting protein-like isoform X2 [Vespula pensylvanica]